MKTWDPLKFVIIVGSHTVTDYAPDTFISAERNKDSMTLSIGADGKGTRVRNADKSGRITITLQKSSPSNNYLAALHNTDEESGQGIVPIQVKDNTNLDGTAVASAENAWVTKPPAFERGAELGTETWVFETDVLNTSPGAVGDTTDL